MGLLDTIERGIERVVRGAFSGRGGSLGPVEIATAVRRHMDRESTPSQSGGYIVPNLYKVRLSEQDFTEAKKYGTSLAEELCDEIIRHADSQEYTLLGPVRTTFMRNSQLKRGQISIETDLDRHINAAEQRPAVSAGQGPAATTAVPGRMRPDAQPPAPAEAALEYNGQRYPLTSEIVIIGRSSSADITIADTGISRQHLEVSRRGHRYYARDLGSTNGSIVNEKQIRGTETELLHGASITLGNARLRFRSE